MLTFIFGVLLFILRLTLKTAFWLILLPFKLIWQAFHEEEKPRK